jgi:hypothetical protein
LNENIKVVFSILTDDPSGLIWIIAALNALTVVCGFREKIWRTKVFKSIVFAQLLVVPVVTAIGFHYAIQPPA